MSTLTYTEVGATRLGPLPKGYHHLHHRTRVGQGADDFAAAGAAVTEWRMHRASGTRVKSSAARAEPGSTVTMALGVGPLRLAATCEVIWTAYGEEGRTGFGYGTLAGHPEIGEECFVVDLADDGTVWFTVMAFSRPGVWYARLAGPIVPRVQLWYARRLGRTLRRLVAAG